jgi:DNA-binding FadR family transcriptional regulator
VGDVAGGRAAPGSRLPREADLATRFGVSRGVARECVRGLEERRIVSVKHGRGATVNPETRWDVLDPLVLEALLDSDGGAAILREYLECRRVLEIEAAGLAAERARPDTLTAMADALARMTAAAELASAGPAAEDLFHEADIEFHRALIAATGNRALGHLTEPIHRALMAARRPLARPGLRRRRALPEHQRILAAVAQGDAPAAREAMHEHLETVAGYLREYAGDTDHAPAAGESRDAG